MRDTTAIRGMIEWELTSHRGLVIARGRARNLVTQIGDQMYAERGAGIAGPPAIPTGMKLGTGSTGPAKTGAGAALGSYLDDSHQAFEDDPTSTLDGIKRRIAYQCIWAEGKATTASAITEVVLVNEALTNATSTAAATIARALLTGISSKAADQQLTVTWYHDLAGV